MRAVLGLTLVLSVSATGCLSTARIKSERPATAAGKYENVPGVPFYTKIATCKQETSWSEPVYTLTLKETLTYKFIDEAAAKKADAKLPDTVVHPATKVLSLSQFQPTNNALQALLATINKPGQGSDADVQVIQDAWQTISAVPDYIPLNSPEDDLVKSKNVVELSNISSPEVMVDYTHIFYYNAPRPLIGSSQIDAKLAADGTLTEGSTQVQSQTGSAILTTVTSVLSTLASKIPAFGSGGPPSNATQRNYAYSLTIQRESYQHTHTRYVPFAVPCALAAGGVTTNYALTVVPPGQTQVSKDDSNSAKFTGTVTLPKTATGTPPKQ